jgi:hypothetical protein
MGPLILWPSSRVALGKHPVRSWICCASSHKCMNLSLLLQFYPFLPATGRVRGVSRNPKGAVRELRVFLLWGHCAWQWGCRLGVKRLWLLKSSSHPNSFLVLCMDKSRSLQSSHCWKLKVFSDTPKVNVAVFQRRQREVAGWGGPGACVWSQGRSSWRILVLFTPAGGPLAQGFLVFIGLQF